MISEQFKAELAERLGATLPNIHQSSRRNYRTIVPSNIALGKQIIHTTISQSVGGQQSSTLPMKSAREQSAGAQPKSKIRLVNQPLSTQMFSRQAVEAHHVYSQQMFEQTTSTPPVESQDHGQARLKNRVATNFNMSASIQVVAPQTGQVDCMASADNQFDLASSKQTTAYSNQVVQQSSSMFFTESTHLGSTAAVQSKSRTRGI